jgi:hypothetical protein
MPGPEPAEGMNRSAATRNVAKYGDPLGFRNPAHYRERYPGATTEDIIGSSSRPNPKVTAGGIAAGLVGTLVGAAAVLSLADEFHNIGAGRGPEITIEGVSAADYPVGFLIKGVSLGTDRGMAVYADVEVGKNLVGRHRFYVTRFYSVA